jgi:hypothetical protein
MWYSTSFAVVLSSNDVDSLTKTIDPNCTDYSCDSLDAMVYTFKYEYADETNGTFNDTFLACTSCDKSDQINDSQLADFLEVIKIDGTTILALVFDPTLAKIEIIPWAKICEADDGSEYNQNIECEKGDSLLGYNNDYAIKDTSSSKIPFQIIVGETYFNASLDVTGTASLTSNIGGVIEATADLEANFHGEVELIINPSDNNYSTHDADTCSLGTGCET